jgi:hypothetical protein
MMVLIGTMILNILYYYNNDSIDNININININNNNKIQQALNEFVYDDRNRNNDTTTSSSSSSSSSSITMTLTTPPLMSSLSSILFIRRNKMIDTNNPIYHLHVGKTGGTSIDELFARQLLPKLKRLYPNVSKPYIGNRHFDWSFIENAQIAYNNININNNDNDNDDNIDGNRYNKTGLLDFLKSSFMTRSKIINGNQAMSVFTSTASEDNAEEEEVEVALMNVDIDVDAGGSSSSSSSSSSSTTINADIIMMVRNPIQRSISQFYYSKTQSWAIDSQHPFLNLTFEQYLDNITVDSFRQPLDNVFMEFLAGITHTPDWIDSDISSSSSNSNSNTKNNDDDDEKIKRKKSIKQKRYLKRNKTAACLLAARRLERNVIWFGILDDIDRSMEMLQDTLQLDYVPKLPSKNKNSKNKFHSTDSNNSNNNYQKELLSKKYVTLLETKYLQQDLWLYRYSKRLFEARYQYYDYLRTYNSTNDTNDNNNNNNNDNERKEERINRATTTYKNIPTKKIVVDLPPLPDFSTSISLW